MRRSHSDRGAGVIETRVRVEHRRYVAAVAPAGSPGVDVPVLARSSPAMDHLDRSRWTGGRCFACYGTRFGVRVNDATVLGRLDPYLPPGRTDTASPVADVMYSLLTVGADPRERTRRSYLLYRGAELVTWRVDLDSLLAELASDLHRQVALLARDTLFVHAGVAAHRGRAIILPGRSFSGKSTLVAALVRTGATYYSDEYAVLDADGRVHPYSKPLSLRGPAGEPARLHTVESLGGNAGTSALPVGMIAVARYERGATWRPEPLTPGQAMLALLDNTVLARYRTRFAFQIFARTVPGAMLLAGARGEADEVARTLLQQLDERINDQRSQHSEEETR